MKTQDWNKKAIQCDYLIDCIGIKVAIIIIMQSSSIFDIIVWFSVMS